MTQRSLPASGLHRFALVTSFFTFILVIAGGMVTSTGSGLSVPDWPLSFGQLMPPMVGGVVYEHSHRLIATFVGACTVVLAVWILRRDHRMLMKILALSAVGAVIIQGVLGGMTVLFLLPTAVSALHATLAQSFFSLMVVLVVMTGKSWHETVPVSAPRVRTTRRLALLAVLAVLLQLLLGAWMRHSNAGRAIPDFPLSFGHVLPPASDEELFALNNARYDQALPPLTLEQIWIHFAHRLGALLATGLIAAVVVHVMREYRGIRNLRSPAHVAGILVAIQFVLGALTVLTEVNPIVATIHVATGALVLASCTVLLVQSYHALETEGEAPSRLTIPELAHG